MTMRVSLIGFGVLLVAAIPAVAQEPNYVQLATESGVCGTAPVLGAIFDAATNSVTATCGGDVTALGSPLVGGLAPALLGGLAFFAVAAGGDGTNGTTGTNGT
jgi:hypothetical protein